MISPEVQRGYLGNEPANVGMPALHLFQVIATGEIVVYPLHYLTHPSLIGTIVLWPVAAPGFGYGNGGYGDNPYGS